MPVNHTRTALQHQRMQHKAPMVHVMVLDNNMRVCMRRLTAYARYQALLWRMCETRMASASCLLDSFSLQLCLGHRCLHT